MAKAEGDTHWISNYAGHTLLQLLALGRTASTARSRQPFAYPHKSDYDQYHKGFLETPRWDEKLQMYVRRDGSTRRSGTWRISTSNLGGKGNS